MIDRPQARVYVGTEVIVGRSLVAYRNPWAVRLTLRSANSLPPALVRALWFQVQAEATHFRLSHRPMALGTHAAVAFEGTQPVGLIDPVVQRRIGGLALLGLVPAVRGRGLSRGLHATGLAALRALGARHYEDSTDVLNTPMRRTFLSNSCQELSRVETWQPEVR